MAASISDISEVIFVSVVLFSGCEGGSTDYQSTNKQTGEVEVREVKDAEEIEKKEENKTHKGNGLVRSRLKRKAATGKQ